MYNVYSLENSTSIVFSFSNFYDIYFSYLVKVEYLTSRALTLITFREQKVEKEIQVERRKYESEISDITSTVSRMVEQVSHLIKANQNLPERDRYNNKQTSVTDHSLHHHFILFLLFKKNWRVPRWCCIPI